MSATGPRRPHPSAEDVERYQNLVAGAASYGRSLLAWRQGGRPGSAELLFRTLKASRGCVMPVAQQFRDSALVRLIRLVDRMTPLTLADRANLAQELLDLVRLVDPSVDTSTPPGTVRQAEPVAPPPQRKPYNEDED